MTPAVFGGLLLIIGAFTISRGKIFLATIIFFCADICWVFIAVSVSDYLGAGLVLTGMIFGALAFWRMNSGKMRKSLDW